MSGVIILVFFFCLFFIIYLSIDNSCISVTCIDVLVFLLMFYGWHDLIFVNLFMYVMPFIFFILFFFCASLSNPDYVGSLSKRFLSSVNIFFLSYLCLSLSASPFFTDLRLGRNNISWFFLFCEFLSVWIWPASIRNICFVTSFGTL